VPRYGTDHAEARLAHADRPGGNGVYQSADWARTMLIAAFRAGLCPRDNTIAARRHSFGDIAMFEPNLRTARHNPAVKPREADLTILRPDFWGLAGTAWAAPDGQSRPGLDLIPTPGGATIDAPRRDP
jgi:hypothetical protein